MALYGSNVEYGLHCLLVLAGQPRSVASARDLATFVGISPSLVAKLFTRLQKAGLVTASEGVAGGYRLARSPERISVLDAVDALDGPKALFECKEIRRNCTLFGDDPPAWATQGLCAIHRLMRQAEARQREVLRQTTLAQLGKAVAGKAPEAFRQQTLQWFGERSTPHARRTRERLP